MSSAAASLRIWREPESGPIAPPSKPAREPLDDVRRKMVERYMPLAANLAAPFIAKLPNYRDELLGAAMLGLAQAARGFDPSRSFDFSTPARHRIRGELLNTVAEIGPGAGGRAFKVVGMPGAEGHDLDGREAVRPFEDRDQVAALLATLPERQATVCRLYYLEGRKLAAIGRELGCTESNACKILKRAIATLRATA